MNETNPPLPSLKDLDVWLTECEAQVPGLRPGVAAGIVWTQKGIQKTSVSLVYLPGYSATRGETFPVPDRVAAALGANLFYARLSGHGGLPEGHRDVTAEQWCEDARQALKIGRLLGDKVVVIGTSTGGTLATLLVLDESAPGPDAVVLISPNLTLKDRSSEILRLPGKNALLSMLVPEVTKTPSRGPLNEQFWDLVHHRHSLIPMMQLVHRARTRDFQRWKLPTLVVYDLDDPVVDEKVTQKLFSRVPSPLITLHRWHTAPGDDSHVLAGDALSPGANDRMTALLTDYLKGVL